MLDFLVNSGRLRVIPGIVLFAYLSGTGSDLAQTAPQSLDRPWHSSEERTFESEATHSQQSHRAIEPDRMYSLAELIDLAEAHNPEARVAWERARARSRFGCGAE